MKGGQFGAIQKFSKKSHNAEKNPSENHQDRQRGILGIFPRFWMSVLFLFVSDEVLKFRVF